MHACMHAAHMLTSPAAINTFERQFKVEKRCSSSNCSSNNNSHSCCCCRGACCFSCSRCCCCCLCCISCCSSCSSKEVKLQLRLQLLLRFELLALGDVCMSLYTLCCLLCFHLMLSLPLSSLPPLLSS